MQSVFYVDDKKESLLLYTDYLAEVFGPDFEMKPMQPLPTVNKMSEFFIDHDDLVAIVLDEIMDDSGIADYTGLELANNLRKGFPNLPIYILTSYIHTITDDEKVIDVEQTISKEMMQDQNQRKILTARIRRHMQTLKVIRDKNQQRFYELLEKSLYEELSNEELDEYKKLDVFRSSKKQTGEIQVDQEFKQKLDEQERLLNKIKKELDG